MLGEQLDGDTQEAARKGWPGELVRASTVHRHCVSMSDLTSDQQTEGLPLANYPHLEGFFFLRHSFCIADDLDNEPMEVGCTVTLHRGGCAL